MGYKKNPFNSDKGMEIVENIFDLLEEEFPEI